VAAVGSKVQVEICSRDHRVRGPRHTREIKIAVERGECRQGLFNGHLQVQHGGSHVGDGQVCGCGTIGLSWSQP